MIGLGTGKSVRSYDLPGSVLHERTFALLSK